VGAGIEAERVGLEGRYECAAPSLVRLPCGSHHGAMGHYSPGAGSAAHASRDNVLREAASLGKRVSSVSGERG
jgi:hypothetical protein